MLSTLFEKWNERRELWEYVMLSACVLKVGHVVCVCVCVCVCVVRAIYFQAL